MSINNLFKTIKNEKKDYITAIQYEHDINELKSNIADLNEKMNELVNTAKQDKYEASESKIITTKFETETDKIKNTIKERKREKIENVFWWVTTVLSAIMGIALFIQLFIAVGDDLIRYYSNLFN